MSVLHSSTLLDLQPGTLVTESLRLVRPLGQGGMGSVWLAQHLSLDMEVAVKFIRPERAGDSNLLRRFEREAKAAASISSPHVVQIKDYGLAEGPTPYIVMERLRGRSLCDAIKQGQRLSLAQVARVVDGVGEALSAAHACDIVHRDIKPQNIFLAETVGRSGEQVMVLDFGVAKVVGDAVSGGSSEITETGVVIGSPPYMSPEQLEGSKHVDQRADTWSLGIVAYQALSGCLPFEGGSFIAVGAAVLSGRYLPITQHRPDLPAQLDDWFAKALCLQPASRFQSAEEMAVAFEAIVAAVPPEQREAVPRLPTESADPALAATAAADMALALAPTTAAEVGFTERATGPVAPPNAPPQLPQPSAEAANSIALDAHQPSRVQWRRAAGIAAAIAALGAAAWLLGEDGFSTTSTPSAAPSHSAEFLPAIVASDCPDGMQFVAAANFDMGAAAGDDVRGDEVPKHRVEVGAFCLDTTEVTVRAYTACKDCDPPPTTVVGKEMTSRARQFWSQFCNGGQPGRADHPINCVSWDQAQGYCQARNKRLPSEQEWELAARGVDGRIYPWGSASPSQHRANVCDGECSSMLSEKLKQIGRESWSAMHAANDGAPATAVVGSFPKGATPEGVQDLAGNVWEWTASYYCYYDEDGCVESRRVLRGGGWDVPNAAAIRTTRRHPGAPNGRGHNIGFRCAWSR